MSGTTQRILLCLARETIEARLADRLLPPLPALDEPAAEVGGVFVTLHHGPRLRGCIGRFHPDTSLAEAVQQMALAVLDDPRFLHCPVTAEEIPRVTIEISVLSPMQRTADPASLQVGVHGIYIRSGGFGGCFLPQVATEQRWTAEQLLARCCTEKAGLPAEAWRDPATEVYLFTSTVFAEGGGHNRGEGTTA